MIEKIILVIDAIFISITAFYILNFDNIERYDPSTAWAMDGLSNLRMFLIALIYLGVELLILIIVIIIMIYKKYHKR